MIKMNENHNAIRRFDHAARGLCQRLCDKVVRISENIKSSAQEIRLRVNKPVAIYTASATFFVTSSGVATQDITPGKMLIATQRDISDSFQTLCSYSVYSRQNEIRRGFITMQGGHRAGLCGTAVYRSGEIYNLRDLTAISIRVSREIFGCADKVMEHIKSANNGVLICGSPSSGKTTLLRDISRQLSTLCNQKTIVIDERGELAGMYAGIAQNDLGLCDVLDGYSKTDGVMQAVRCLSPDYIICDEIGAMEEIELLQQSLNAGVRVIASVHASSREEFMKKPQGEALIKSGAFEKVVFLKSRNSPGEIKEVVSKEVLLDGQSSRHNNDNLRRSAVGGSNITKGNKPNFVF